MLKKEITFIYMDTAEKSIYEPLAREAEKRGYKTKLTRNVFEKSEIGFYCQHINFPQFSKFSVIMLHDIIQQYSNWPDLWFREPWNKYDIGILPSNQWVKNWNECSQWKYARPRVGMYKVGWPKADFIAQVMENSYREEFYHKYGLDLNKRTILYAPAWENDNKQDDFVQSMLKLDVNILIKQADFPEDKFPVIAKNIKEMHLLHKDMERVTILPPKTNIFNAIAVSDILVSEESSTMCEAIMMGVPAVSVSDWLIPDVTPSRLPKCDYDFVTMTTKGELNNCINEMIGNYSFYKSQAEKKSEENFSNIGKSASMIMDIIDDCVEAKTVRYKSLPMKKKERIPFRKYVVYCFICFKRELHENYCQRSKLLNAIWISAKWVKDMIKKVIK